MPFANPEDKKAYDRQRYAKKRGLILEDNEGSPSSLPEPVPGQEKVPEFSSHPRQVRAENFLRGHWKPIAYSIIGVGSLVILYLFRFRIKEQMDNLKSIASSYTLKPEATPRDSIEALLDYSEDVMRRAAGSV